MSRVIIIQLTADQIRAVVARANGDALQVEAVETLPVLGTDVASAGKQLSASLEDYNPTKAKVFVAVPSSSIKWQYLVLPPCPAEDLPALVRLQLDLESSREEEAIGYDYLPLAGSPDRPQRVLAMILKVAELARVRNLGRVSGLKVESVVPLAMGWTALVGPTSAQSGDVKVFLALENREATIWATSAGELALLRQVQLAEEWQAPTAAMSIAGQLRRSILSLAQEEIATDAAPVIVLGEPTEALSHLAAALGEQLSRSVELASPSEVILPPHVQSERGELQQLLGLAWRAVRNQPVQFDFLHPRKPPAPQSNRRTVVLGGIAAALLALVVGWQGYAALNEPLWTAEKLEDELHAIKQDIEPLEAEERDATRIRDWLATSPNLLTELAELSKDWRPRPLDASDFAIAEDGVLKRIEINNRRLVLTGNVTSSAAVQPLENRLRDEGHRVRREQSEPAADGGQYPWQVQVVVDVVADQPMEAQP